MTSATATYVLAGDGPDRRRLCLIGVGEVMLTGIWQWAPAAPVRSLAPAPDDAALAAVDARLRPHDGAPLERAVRDLRRESGELLAEVREALRDAGMLERRRLRGWRITAAGEEALATYRSMVRAADDVRFSGIDLNERRDALLQAGPLLLLLDEGLELVQGLRRTGLGDPWQHLPGSVDPAALDAAFHPHWPLVDPVLPAG